MGRFLLVCLLIAGAFVASNSLVSSSGPGTYVALGDSIAAGSGFTKVDDPTKCSTSPHAYPTLVAKDLNYKLTNYACGGATIWAGVMGSQYGGKILAEPQVSKLFEAEKPDLITVSIGLNDVSWGKLLDKCFESRCGTPEDDEDYGNQITKLQYNYDLFLSTLKSRYGDKAPTIIATDYNQVFPFKLPKKCSALKGITAAELKWERAYQQKINQTIEKTLQKYDFVKFARIDFSGHEICTKDPWVNGINEAPIYHPNEAGQKVYAKAIKEAMQ